MDQISRPLLLVLLAAVGFAAAWMTVLRPQAATTGQETSIPAPAAPPAASGLTRAVEKAKAAAGASDASTAAKEEGAANAGQAPSPAPAKTVPPKAAGAKAKPAGAPPAPAAKPAADRKVTVLLFAGAGADDSVARDVVRSARRPGVRVIVASLRDVASYKNLLGGIEVSAAPTILVIGKDRKAQRIEGLPDSRQVEQALRAAR